MSTRFVFVKRFFRVDDATHASKRDGEAGILKTVFFNKNVEIGGLDVLARYLNKSFRNVSAEGRLHMFQKPSVLDRSDIVFLRSSIGLRN